MIDVKILRENPEIVKENIRKKFQDVKLPLVNEVIEYDEKSRTAQGEADQLRAERKRRGGAEAAAVWVQAADHLGALCLHRTEVGGCVFQLGGCDV